MQPSALQEFPNYVFTEIHRVLWPEIQKVTGSNPGVCGEFVAQEIVRIVNASSEIFVAISRSRISPKSRSVSVFNSASQPERRGPPKRSQTDRRGNEEVFVEQALGLPPKLQIAQIALSDASPRLYSLSSDTCGQLEIFSSCLFRMMYNSLNARNLVGVRCRNNSYARGLVSSFDKDMGLFLATKPPGWITGTANPLSGYTTTILREAIVGVAWRWLLHPVCLVSKCTTNRSHKLLPRLVPW